MHRILSVATLLTAACLLAACAPAPPPATPTPTAAPAQPTPPPGATAEPSASPTATLPPAATSPPTPTSPAVTLDVLDQLAELATFTAPDSAPIVDMDLSTDGAYLAAVTAGTIEVWNTTGEQTDVETIPVDSTALHSISIETWEEQGDVAVGTADNRVVTWNFASSESVVFHAFAASPPAAVNAVDFHPDQPDQPLLAAANSAGQIVVLDRNSGQQQFTISVGAAVEALTYTPDGAIIVSGGANGLLQYWDAQTGEGLYTGSIGHDAPILAVATTPDSLLFASGGADRVAKLYDGFSAEWLGTLMGHASNVQALAFSPDGTLLASADSAGTLIIWDVVLRAEAARMAAPHAGEAITALAWSPDGARLYSAGEDGSIRAWGISE